MICHLGSRLPFRATLPQAGVEAAISSSLPTSVPLQHRLCLQRPQDMVTNSIHVARGNGYLGADLTLSPGVFGSVVHGLPEIVSLLAWLTVLSYFSGHPSSRALLPCASREHPPGFTLTHPRAFYSHPVEPCLELY